MVARRRQEVPRPTDTVLSARVVRRGASGRPRARRHAHQRAEEYDTRPNPHEFRDSPHHNRGYDQDLDDGDFDDSYADDVNINGHRDEETYMDPSSGDQRLRRGRGGFDPEIAAEQAHQRYARRQRQVLTMLVAAILTGVAAIFIPTLWWPHGVIDLLLIGYLGYLRRQVRIENEIRRRRTARLATRRLVTHRVAEARERMYEAARERMIPEEPAEPDHPVLTRRRPPPPRSPHPDAYVVELDDEDPAFDELEHFADDYYYRRASGQ